MTSGQETRLALTCSGLVTRLVNPAPEKTEAFEAKRAAPPRPLSPPMTSTCPKFPL